MPESSAASAADPGLAGVNALPVERCRAEFARCLDVGAWVEALARGRPYASRAELLAAAGEYAAAVSGTEIADALARHPRIGERAEGEHTEARWSRDEQSGLEGADDDLRAALRDGNAEYERRFGHIYLVCASGRSAAELLADLRARLDNDPATELRVAGRELRAIALVRLAKLLDAQEAAAGRPEARP
ncbi:2-oxo-4-hydroxy-4-carboxy-5-ureidoimidazoline decarboxylase [Marinitenerispora sediminis]|uniref:2-oxo-4-hydroxy-4-carboxy-5-ureidoimidazoline decarboxylase n=1 Tax=Marinitenerispora sediminis TaxID=1931232 RepID=A0A368T139_9ACTN|nr:2-oxo-4-hydroxy-4-carboxy-5-ureidoimidazoline decarboxylase [Marinitenerispora sediminis]RCV52730.1 2-oxo-4-hydroxy-4-carboxy-5-ureidoimidazoline decarboxylase [Marinitenerispora sediminis]RCV53693.1 2-oxo-4-hydroxy-4-carboxy-5-ureidoimidazoline decarboxylase [Marinitenerispora sediminis]RCV56079.1 2-oxo-4-hydroxy-4-carboxy-5-ureidoimidazoline decarboxylase [Marinitenerispora sediminis]